VKETLQQTIGQMRFCHQIVDEPRNSVGAIEQHKSMLDMVIQPPSSKPQHL
jgi:hypothetical protein